MGKRGPAKTPTHLRVARGTASPDDLAAEVNAPQGAMPAAPDWLDLDAAGVWARLAPTLHARGVLTLWDVDAFAALCTAIVHHRRAAREVNERGVLVGTGRDRAKNPALQVVRDQAALIVSLGGRFGLTPADRVGLRLADEETPEDAGNAFA